MLSTRALWDIRHRANYFIASAGGFRDIGLVVIRGTGRAFNMVHYNAFILRYSLRK